MSNNFFAMVHRMRYINRWGLMRNTEPENISEHSLQVAIIAHALAVLRRRLDDGRPPVDEGQAVLFALYHDASEILTGDLPTPVKYLIRPSVKLTRPLNRLRPANCSPCCRRIPRLGALSAAEPDDPSVAATYRLVKAADRISAYIKCIDEEKAGNRNSPSPARHQSRPGSSGGRASGGAAVCGDLPAAFSTFLDELQW